MNRRHNEQHPRCPFCGAWAQWDGIELICNNVRCRRGPAPGSGGGKSKICGRCPLHRMPKAKQAKPIDGQLTLDLGGETDEPANDNHR